MKLFFTILAILSFTLNNSFKSQITKFGFKKILTEKGNLKMPFAIVNNGQKTFDALFANNILVKSVTKEYIYVTTTPEKIQALIDKNLISDFHFEISRPTLMNDSTRMKTFVNEVQNGTNGLSMPFTGKNVIIGIVDDGIDFKHPDFLDANGKTRFLYLWDQSLDSATNLNIPQPYDYGLEYDSSDINLHISTYNNASPIFPTLGGEGSHGTNVTGIAVGNGLADGLNKGMAPDSKVIFVKTNFNLPNWTLTVSDACDFIFKKADALGMPCVINLSLGDYFGSHDGNDPASVIMESMLDAKPGRIIVCAAGNSGALGKYHVNGIVDSDTSFTWFENNASGAFGANTIYYDLWANQADMTNVSYAFGANLPSGTFSKRASTQFRNILTGMGGVIYDTLRNLNNNILATIEIYPSQQGNAYRLEAYFSKVDSTSYLYSFKTTGSGKYDIWSGTQFGLNNIVSTIPSSAVLPAIIHYNIPDTLQTIVSSWACSEKVITVGNFHNRQSFLNKNGVMFSAATGTSGVLSPNSSKGPSRANVLKPDICAPGDVSLTTAPLWILNNPANNNKIDFGGWHFGNGGTSMASPSITGIAALYLEKCNNATYNDFKTDLNASAMSDNHTGTLPNFGYGNGKVNALNTLLTKNFTTQIVGNTLFCDGTENLSINSAANIDSVVWNFNNSEINSLILSIDTGSTYTAYSYSNLSCKERNQITVVQGIVPITPTIGLVGAILTSSIAPNYQWYLNGVLLAGQTFQTLNGNINPSGQYYVSTSGPDGCNAVSNIYQQNAGISENINEISIFPNPTENSFEILNVSNIKKVILEDLNGKTVKEITSNTNKIDVSDLKKGMYFLKIICENQILCTKIERL